MLKTLLFMAISLTVLVGCNSDDNNSQAANSSDSTAAEGSENAIGVQSSAAGANIKLVVTGGDMAGTYEATCSSTCCSHGIAGENVFGIQFTGEGKGEKELTSVQLMAGDVTGNKTTKEFLVTVSFGDVSDAKRKSYTIQTSKFYNIKKEGSGTLDIEYTDTKSKVKLQGKTSDNVELDLTVECHSTM